MSPRPVSPRPKSLTELELEIMNIVWDQKEATVRSVVDELSKKRKLAYTTVATMMKILVDKKILKDRKNDRVHVFLPLLPREEYQTAAITHLTRNVFSGEPRAAVMKLLETQDLDEEELKRLKKIIEEKLNG
jgi:predicted transcriptional regulator